MGAHSFASDFESNPALYWDKIADAYPEKFSLLYKRKKEFDRYLVDAHVNEFGGPQGALLDAGCGKGGDLAYFAHLAFDRVVGVDHSQRMLLRVRERIQHCQEPRVSEKIEFYQNDIQALPFDDGTFFVSCSFSTIDHLRQPEERMAAFDELIRVTRRDGLVVLTLPNESGLASKLKERYELHVSPAKLGDRDVVCVQERAAVARPLEYEIETTYGPTHLRDMLTTAKNAERSLIHYTYTFHLPEEEPEMGPLLDAITSTHMPKDKIRFIGPTYASNINRLYSRHRTGVLVRVNSDIANSDLRFQVADGRFVVLTIGSASEASRKGYMIDSAYLASILSAWFDVQWGNSIDYDEFVMERVLQAANIAQIGDHTCACAVTSGRARPERSLRSAPSATSPSSPPARRPCRRSSISWTPSRAP